MMIPWKLTHGTHRVYIFSSLLTKNKNKNKKITRKQTIKTSVVIIMYLCFGSIFVL